MSRARNAVVTAKSTDGPLRAVAAGRVAAASFQAERGEVTLLTLHDLGPDWAIVLTDSRYLARVAAPAALAFFDASGSLVARELVRKLHQPAQVRAALRRRAPDGCPF